MEDLNISVVVGTINRLPETRTNQSGDLVWSCDLTVTRPEERSEIVPIIWFDGPDWLINIKEGDELAVIGRVRKRFYQSNYGLQSRTELIVEKGYKATFANISKLRDRATKIIDTYADFGIRG